VEAKDVAKRAPNTTTDLPLFLKRLPDPEPADAGLPAARQIEPSIDVKIERTVEPASQPSVDHAAEAALERPVERLVERPVEPSSARPIERDLERPIERPVLSERPRDAIAAEIDRPLVKLPASPRAPLSVRRNAEQPVRKSEPEISFKRDGIDRDLLDELDLHGSAGPSGPKISRRPESRTTESAGARAAGPVGRLLAAILDAAFLAGVGAAVLWITLRVIGLTMADLPGLPILVALPLATFVLLIYLGYLLLFTAAGGQTLGKMAARIRVIGMSAATGDDERLNIQRAAVRSLLTVPSVLALGAGFLPALVGDRRAVHDRLAQTRVVRV
jgi:uncharacterized RDD family membrane protein YckC